MTRSQSVVRYLVGTYKSPTSMLAPLWRVVPLNATTEQVLGLELAEQRAYLENLWQFNHHPKQARAAHHDDLYGHSKGIGFLRRFNQLPCTVESRRARADLLRELNPAASRILILGDDDLLAVELAQRGFRHVTVADCDERLLERIRDETKDLATPPQIIAADFRAGFVWDGHADVIFLDPPYSVSGAEAFLQLAIAHAAPKSRIYLMINPFVVGRPFSQVIAKAVHAGYHLAKQRPSFNGYPIGWFESTILRLAWRYFLGVQNAPKAPEQLYFCSDCFEFQRG